VHFRTEGVTNPIDRANHRRLVVVIGKCAAKLLHESHERRVRDERCRPEPFVQLALAKDPGSLVHEQEQQIECFRRQMDAFPFAKETSSRSVERKGAELHHRFPPGIPWLSPGFTTT
jgi:hypothetical protein